MEALTLLIVIIAVIMILKEDESVMDEQQMKECNRLKGETQLEKRKAKWSLYKTISNIANMFKI
jgi:hypothetical protein